MQPVEQHPVKWLCCRNQRMRERQSHDEAVTAVLDVQALAVEPGERWGHIITR